MDEKNYVAEPNTVQATAASPRSYGELDSIRDSFGQRFLDSFKRDTTFMSHAVMWQIQMEQDLMLSRPRRIPRIRRCSVA